MGYGHSLNLWNSNSKPKFIIAFMFMEIEDGKFWNYMWVVLRKKPILGVFPWRKNSWL
jgi:hypothetical protein